MSQRQPKVDWPRRSLPIRRQQRYIRSPAAMSFLLTGLVSHHSTRIIMHPLHHFARLPDTGDDDLRLEAFDQI